MKCVAVAVRSRILLRKQFQDVRRPSQVALALQVRGAIDGRRQLGSRPQAGAPGEQECRGRKGYRRARAKHPEPRRTKSGGSGGTNDPSREAH